MAIYQNIKDIPEAVGGVFAQVLRLSSNGWRNVTFTAREGLFENAWLEELNQFADTYFDKDGLNRRGAGKLLRRWSNRKINGVTMKLDDRDSKSTRHRVKFSMS